LKTEFGKIGPFPAPSQGGERKFSVSEVLPLLNANIEADAKMRADILTFIGMDERGEVSYNVTLMRVNDEYIVKDGNKRTIAFFEGRRDQHDVIEFPVFVVQKT